MTSPPGLQTQYQHFIPQFILRNFSHKHSPLSHDSKSASRRRKRSKKTKLYPGDLVLHIIDLKYDITQLSESPTKRTFGLMDMYRDVSNAADHIFLEKEIGKLEDWATVIIANIRKPLESGKGGFSMSRDERDMLRKFLFIMKYRGPGYHRRFHGDESGNYHEDDEGPFKNYIQKKGFHNPVDVWLESIKTILGLEMDFEGTWQERLWSEIYPYDAVGFIIHMEWCFLAFCTPEDLKDEFLLTENCYNVHEGPNNTVMNPETGEHEVVAWTSFHEFSPVTPKLMLVLRSLLLPNSEEDANENIKKWRKDLLEANSRFHVNPASVTSFLEDLPVKKPRNSYTYIDAHGIQFLPGEDGSRRSYHRFNFSFFKINTDLVHKINCVLLDIAHCTSTIAFNAEASLKESLEYYLQLPADQGFKMVHPYNYWILKYRSGIVAKPVRACSIQVDYYS